MGPPGPGTDIHFKNMFPDGDPGLVAMQTEERFKKELGAGAGLMGIRLEEETLDRFFLFSFELGRFNARVNLVSRKKPDWVRTHFLDSLAPLSLGLVSEEGRVLDLGAGAGFPGIPLKLARPGLTLDLAESSGKKCAWLRHLLRVLGLEGTAVLEGRFEGLPGRGYAGAYDLVVARAVARPESVMGAAKPFLKPGGRLLVFTRMGLVEEKAGKVHPYTVPGLTIPSAIWEVSF